MPYVLAISVVVIYLYFRFGQRALAGVFAFGALLALFRGFVVLAVPLGITAYWLWWWGGFFLPGRSGRAGRRDEGEIPSTMSQSERSQPVIISQFLSLFLNEETGGFEVRVRNGPMMGRMFSTLSQAELRDLKIHYEQYDRESAALLYAYLDWAFPEWRRDEGTVFDETLLTASAAKLVSRQQGFLILGLRPDADETEIKSAHRLLMKRFHPDQGGAAIVAAKINMAKDALLGT